MYSLHSGSIVDQFFTHTGYDWTPVDADRNDVLDFWSLLHVEQQGQFIQDAVDITRGDCMFFEGSDGTRYPADPTSKDCIIFGHDDTVRGCTLPCRICVAGLTFRPTIFTNMRDCVRRTLREIMSSLPLPLMLGLLGCDPIIHVRGDVVVPVNVLRHFSTAMPGRLFLSATTTKGIPELFDGLKIICDAQETNLVVPLRIDRAGCATEMLLKVKATLVSQAAAPCGTDGHAPGMADSEVVVAEGEQAIFVGRSSCADDTAVVHLTLVETAP